MTAEQSCRRRQIALRQVSLRGIKSWSEVCFQQSGLDRRRWCRWLNDLTVRQHLESTGEWTVGRLRDWVNSSVTTLGTRLYALNVDGEPVGTLKLDHVERGGWPSLGLMIGDKKVWGKGVGTAAIEKGCRIAKRAGCAGVWAGIRGANVGSRRAFTNAHFVEMVGKDSTGSRFLGPVPEAVALGVGQWSHRPARVAVMRKFW